MKKISSCLRFLATGTMSLLLTACYGVKQVAVMYGMPTTVSRIGSFKILKNNEPVEDIMVVYNDIGAEVDYSNKEGIVQYELEMDLDMSIEVFLSEKDSEGNYQYTGIEEELDDDDSTIDSITME